MKISGIIWLEEIVQKLIWKHSVSQNEVYEIFENKPKFRFVEKGHRAGENVYSVLGQTDAGRYLAVFFVYKKSGEALILSARSMSKSQRKLYEKK